MRVCGCVGVCLCVFVFVHALARVRASECVRVFRVRAVVCARLRGCAVAFVAVCVVVCVIACVVACMVVASCE